jgi:hypothetical protein
MKNDKIDHQLIDEYGLNPLTYRLLRLASKSDIEWNGPGLRAITTQPANGLRKLVERGLLSGPGRTEKINCRPFALTDAGRDTLARIERGLQPLAVEVAE